MKRVALTVLAAVTLSACQIEPYWMQPGEPASREWCTHPVVICGG